MHQSLFYYIYNNRILKLLDTPLWMTMYSCHINKDVPKYSEYFMFVCMYRYLSPICDSFLFSCRLEHLLLPLCLDRPIFPFSSSGLGWKAPIGSLRILLSPAQEEVYRRGNNWDVPTQYNTIRLHFQNIATSQYLSYLVFTIRLGCFL